MAQLSLGSVCVCVCVCVFMYICVCVRSTVCEHRFTLQWYQVFSGARHPVLSSRRLNVYMKSQIPRQMQMNIKIIRCEVQPSLQSVSLLYLPDLHYFVIRRTLLSEASYVTLGTINKQPLLCDDKHFPCARRLGFECPRFT